MSQLTWAIAMVQESWGLEKMNMINWSGLCEANPVQCPMRSSWPKNNKSFVDFNQLLSVAFVFMQQSFSSKEKAV